MYGLSGDDKNTKQDFSYELEKKLKNGQEVKKIKDLLEKRIQSLKNEQRKGEKQDLYEILNILLLGYQSASIIAVRVAENKS